MIPLLRRLVLVMLIAAAAGYGSDWAVYKIRKSPTATIKVSHFISAQLKNEKQEIDYLGSEDVLCSATLFPQDGHSPCWYLSRHKNQVSTY